MDIFKKKINRKVFLGLFLLLAVVLSFARVLLKSPSDAEVTVGVILSGFFIVGYCLIVHLRCNHLNGTTNMKESIKYIILSCIPLVGFVVILYLIFAKGYGTSTKKEGSYNNPKSPKISVDDIVRSLQTKYAGQLNIEGDMINSQICQDLYAACNKIESSKKIILEYNLDVNDIAKLYKAMKSDNVLWDDSTGMYLPFVAILNPSSLLKFANNQSIPSLELKRLILSEVSKNNKFVNAHEYNGWHRILRDTKKLWILIFLIISVAMMLYPPYHKVVPNKGDEFVGYSFIGTFPNKTTNATKKYTSIDYATLSFHEVIWAVVCCTGYTLMVTIRKK